MRRASKMPLTSIPEEVDNFKLVMNRLGMEKVMIGEYTQFYNPRFTTKEKAMKELRESVEADTCLPSNSE